MFELQPCTAQGPRRIERDVEVSGSDRETVLVNWLNECLYVHDLEGFGVADVTRPELTAGGVHAVLRGEPIDPGRHPRGTIVKAATYHGLEIRRDPRRVSVRVVLDI